METDAMFLEFKDDLDNIAGGSSSVGDNAGESKNFLHFNLQLFHLATSTPRRRAQSRLLELKRHVTINEHISMTIAPEQKSLFSHTPFASVRREACACERHFSSAALSEQTLGENTLRSSRATSRCSRPLKSFGTTSASSSSTSCLQSTQTVEIELQAKLNETLERIEVQDKNHQALVSQVERMQKLIEDLTRAQ
uniref:CACTA en-spm transposon protein n=2 Tax=Cucumis melo TaxID=3656 RepID=A0A9I9ECR9_CUCME